MLGSVFQVGFSPTQDSDGAGPARGASVPVAFSEVNRVCVALLHGRAGRLAAKNGGARADTTVWGIHLKSQPSGGATGHGWPDETYWTRLQSELAAVGVLDEGFGRAAPVHARPSFPPAPHPERLPASRRRSLRVRR